MAGYLLDLLRDVAVDLGESDLPAVEETRKVLGALVRRVESLELYLTETATTTSSAPGSTSGSAGGAETPPPAGSEAAAAPAPPAETVNAPAAADPVVETQPVQPVTPASPPPPAPFQPGQP